MKKIRKKGLLVVFGLVLLSASLSQAQNQTVNTQLRTLFDNLNTPLGPPADALYDRAMHMTDQEYWTNNSYINTNTENWATMYDEFYYMLEDTTDLDKTDSVFMDVLGFAGDTIPLGLIHMNFHQFVDSALFSHDTIYFFEDSTIFKLADYPGREAEPYLHKQLFTFSPLESGILTNHVTYRIDPDFIFRDAYVTQSYEKSRWQLQIDLDDGTGWQNVDLNVVSHWPVDYTTGSNDRIIKARIIGSNGSTICHSQSMFKVVASGQQQIPPDQFFSMDGMNIGLYEPCSGTPQNDSYKKYVIYLEGFDIFESVTVSDIYNSSIRNSRLAELRNHGYTFVVVDWQNSARDMRANANSVISLIEYLKCELASGVSDIDSLPPFILFGESMGGVIGRYALTKMEQRPSGRCLPSLLHNTRLFVSVDAPHQGANVPMAFQEFYRDVLGPLYHLPINVKVKGIWIRNYLNSMAPRQLLSSHVSTNVWPFASYYPHPDRIAFMNDLRNLDGGDGYPDHVKKFAISDGLLTGEHQMDITSVNTMNPGDNFLDADAAITFRILGIPVVGATGTLDLKAMPAIGNTFYKRSLQINHWGISITWKTIKVGPCPFCIKLKIPVGINVGFVGSTISSHTAVNGNLPQLDHMPGGLLSFDNAIPGGGLSNQMNFINWTVGPIAVPNTPLTIPGFQVVGLNFNWSITTEGLTFNFVPVQSALDYSGAANRLDHNIFNENINTKLARTPFDVIMGEYNGLPNFPNNGAPLNLSHIRVRNSNVNLPLLNGLDQYILNREVGEEQLWLDNWHVHNQMIPKLEAEYVITGGTRENRYYDYPGQLNGHVFYPHPSPSNNGVFSKREPFRIDNYAILKSDGTLIDNGIIGPYGWLNLPQYVCNQTFRKISPDINRNSEEIENSLGVKLYPNPNQGEFTIEFQDDFVQPEVTIINSNGQVIRTVGVSNHKTSIGADLGLSKGVYLIRITDVNKEPILQRLIIQ